MRKIYEAPEAEIEEFLLPNAAITTSGFDDGGDTGETVDW